MTVRFVRALGAARTGHVAAARDEVAALRALRDPVLRDAGAYWAGLVDVYADAAEAWADCAAGDRDAALRLMQEAAALDDGRAKLTYLQRIGARDAYRRAMSKGDPDLVPLLTSPLPQSR